MPPRRRHAFSVIELLLAAAVIAILAGIALANWGIARKKTGDAVRFHEENKARTDGAMQGNFEDNRHP